MFGTVALHLDESMRPTREFLSNILGAYGANTSSLVDRDVHDMFAASIIEHHDAWMKYADEMDAQLASADRTV